MGEDLDGKLQKLTLNVPADVIERAKIAAITRRTSLSKVVTEALRQFAQQDAAAAAGGEPLAATTAAR